MSWFFLLLEMFPFPSTCANATQAFLPTNWYKLNTGGQGFYRADYSKEDWVSLKKQLDHDHEVSFYACVEIAIIFFFYVVRVVTYILILIS